MGGTVTRLGGHGPPFSPLAHRLFYYSYPPIKICFKAARHTQTSINVCEHTGVITFVLDNTLRFGQWRNLNNMTDMKRNDFV